MAQACFRLTKLEAAAAIAAEKIRALKELYHSLGLSEAVIFATGPSLPILLKRWRAEGLLRIAVNDAYLLVPNAEVLYATDHGWWKQHGGCKDFAGAKIGYGTRQAADVIALQSSGVTGYDPRPGWIRVGNNSGCAAIHLAAHLGMRRIFLVGFDMRRIDGKLHFFGDHPHKPKPQAPDFPGWIRNIILLARELAVRGIEIVNHTPGSALRRLPALSSELAAPVNSHASLARITAHE